MIRRSDGYRCDACRGRANRCDACRAMRSEMQRKLRRLKRRSHICTHCAERALKGGTLCLYHNAMNNRLSAASHARARADQ